MNLKKIPLSLYIHLPWCEKKCPYCDFNISTNKNDIDEKKLIESIIRDIESSYEKINGRRFISIYFGGGTPSLVKAKMIEKIISHLENKNLIQNNAEISFEFNPNEINNKYLDSICSIGINRLSIGIQSFDNKTLNSLERNHDENKSIEALEIVSKYHHVKSSIDLIYGVMDQSIDSFVEDLEKFCSYDLIHLSLYQLTIEPNTIFYKKELRIPSEEIIESMELCAKRILNSNGYSQYEVSSWSKKGFEGIHNMNYWTYGDYLGVGPGAHSKITKKNGIYRSLKLKKLSSYIENPIKDNGGLVPPEDIDIDIAMNFLRIKKGVSFEKIQQNCLFASDQFQNKLYDAIDRGLISSDRFKATKKGFKFLNDTVNLFS